MAIHKKRMKKKAINKLKDLLNIESHKIKDLFLSVVAIVVLFGSMGSTLGDLIQHYGKGAALWYFFLYFWALRYASKGDAEKISNLEIENERLKERIDFSNGINKELEAKLENLRNQSQQESI